MANQTNQGNSSIENFPQANAGGFKALAFAAALLFTVPGCGSGAAAALFGSDSSGSTPSDPVFQISFPETRPRMFPTMQDALDDTTGGINSPGVFIRFSTDIDDSTVQVDDFIIERLNLDGTEVVETLPVISMSTSSNSTTLFLSESLALNGLYRVEMVGEVLDVLEQEISGSRIGFVRIAEGNYRSVPETVTFGQSSAGGITLGSGNRAYASIEAALGNLTPFMVGATTAPRDGLWESPAIVYLGESDPFNTPQTAGIGINGNLAILPIQEGEITAVHNANRSVVIKAFPGTVLPTGRIEWGPATIASVDPERYRVDKGTPGSPLDANHISFRGNIYPLSPSQANSNNPLYVTAFWAIHNEVGAEFQDYSIFVNSLQVGAGVPGEDEWLEVGEPLTTGDRAVGWPYMTGWPSGRIAMLWNDGIDDPDPDNIPGRASVFAADVAEYGLSIFNSALGGWQPIFEISDNGNDLSRATAVRAFGTNGLLVISRIDRSALGEGLASIGARVLQVTGAGVISGGLGSIQVAPEPDGPYSSPLGYEGLDANNLPVATEYYRLREAPGKGPKAVSIDGARYLVTWSTDGGGVGDASPIVGLFDTEMNRWANSVLNLRSLIGSSGSLGDVQVQQVLVDRLGFATVFWSETVTDVPSGSLVPIRLLSLRTTTSLLAVDLDASTGVGSLEAAFEGAEPVIITEPIEGSDFSILPVVPNISSVDGSGQFIVAWEEFLFSGGVLSRTGTRATRFGQN